MNHSFEPNVVYQKDPVRMVIRFRAIRAVVKGEELLINYNGDPDDKTPVRFS
jgi:SET domain-containing protein